MFKIKNGVSAPAILLALLLITIFGVVTLPDLWLSFAYRILLIIVLIAVIFSLDRKYRHFLKYSVIFLLVPFLFTFVFEIRFLYILAMNLNALFFAFIVSRLLLQISKSNTVTSGVIVQAVNGYLLLGIVFSIFVAVIDSIRPGSFSFPEGKENFKFSFFYNHLYYGFITMATVGYGDIVPKTPFAKIFSILIGLAGQLYIAIIIALLVGKYAAQGRTKE